MLLMKNKNIIVHLQYINSVDLSFLKAPSLKKITIFFNKQNLFIYFFTFIIHFCLSKIVYFIYLIDF